MWTERGGPAVAPPTRRSFGTRMMESLGQQLNGGVQLVYAPAGFVYLLDVPLGSVAAGTETTATAYTSSSVQTLKLTSVLGPNVWVIGTSAASRPCAIRTRPMRGVLLRASKVYQRPPRKASNQP